MFTYGFDAAGRLRTLDRSSYIKNLMAANPGYATTYDIYVPLPVTYIYSYFNTGLLASQTYGTTPRLQNLADVQAGDFFRNYRDDSHVMEFYGCDAI